MSLRRHFDRKNQETNTMQDLRSSLRSLSQTMQGLLGPQPTRHQFGTDQTPPRLRIPITTTTPLRGKSVGSCNTPTSGQIKPLSAKDRMVTSTPKSGKSSPFLFMNDNSGVAVPSSSRQVAQQPPSLSGINATFAVPQARTASAQSAFTARTLSGTTTNSVLGASRGPTTKAQVHPDVHVTHAEVQAGRLSMSRIPHHEHVKKRHIILHGGQTPANSPSKQTIVNNASGPPSKSSVATVGGGSATASGGAFSGPPGAGIGAIAGAGSSTVRTPPSSVTATPFNTPQQFKPVQLTARPAGQVLQVEKGHLDPRHPLSSSTESFATASKLDRAAANAVVNSSSSTTSGPLVVGANSTVTATTTTLSPSKRSSSAGPAKKVNFASGIEGGLSQMSTTASSSNMMSNTSSVAGSMARSSSSGVSKMRSATRRLLKLHQAPQFSENASPKLARFSMKEGEKPELPHVFRSESPALRDLAVEKDKPHPHVHTARQHLKSAVAAVRTNMPVIPKIVLPGQKRPMPKSGTPVVTTATTPTTDLTVNNAVPSTTDINSRMLPPGTTSAGVAKHEKVGTPVNLNPTTSSSGMATSAASNTTAGRPQPKVPASLLVAPQESMSGSTRTQLEVPPPLSARGNKGTTANPPVPEVPPTMIPDTTKNLANVTLDNLNAHIDDHFTHSIFTSGELSGDSATESATALATAPTGPSSARSGSLIIDRRGEATAAPGGGYLASKPFTETSPRRVPVGEGEEQAFGEVEAEEFVDVEEQHTSARRGPAVEPQSAAATVLDAANNSKPVQPQQQPFVASVATIDNEMDVVEVEQEQVVAASAVLKILEEEKVPTKELEQFPDEEAELSSVAGTLLPEAEAMIGAAAATGASKQAVVLTGGASSKQAEAQQTRDGFVSQRVASIEESEKRMSGFSPESRPASASKPKPEQRPTSAVTAAPKSSITARQQQAATALARQKSGSRSPESPRTPPPTRAKNDGNNNADLSARSRTPPFSSQQIQPSPIQQFDTRIVDAIHEIGEKLSQSIRETVAQSGFSSPAAGARMMQRGDQDLQTATSITATGGATQVQLGGLSPTQRRLLSPGAVIVLQEPIREVIGAEEEVLRQEVLSTGGGLPTASSTAGTTLLRESQEQFYTPQNVSAASSTEFAANELAGAIAAGTSPSPPTRMNNKVLAEKQPPIQASSGTSTPTRTMNKALNRARTTPPYATIPEEELEKMKDQDDRRPDSLSRSPRTRGRGSTIEERDEAIQTSIIREDRSGSRSRRPSNEEVSVSISARQHGVSVASDSVRVAGAYSPKRIPEDDPDLLELKALWNSSFQNSPRFKKKILHSDERSVHRLYSPSSDRSRSHSLSLNLGPGMSGPPPGTSSTTGAPASSRTRNKGRGKSRGGGGTNTMRSSLQNRSLFPANVSRIDQDQSLMEVDQTLIDQLNTSNVKGTASNPGGSSTPADDSVSIPSSTKRTSPGGVAPGANVGEGGSPLENYSNSVGTSKMSSPGSGDVNMTTLVPGGSSPKVREPVSSRGNRYTKKVKEDDPDLLALKQMWTPFQIRPLAANRGASQDRVVVTHGDSPYKNTTRSRTQSGSPSRKRRNSANGDVLPWSQQGITSAGGGVGTGVVLAPAPAVVSEHQNPNEEIKSAGEGGPALPKDSNDGPGFVFYKEQNTSLLVEDEDDPPVLELPIPAAQEESSSMMINQSVLKLDKVVVAKQQEIKRRTGADAGDQDVSSRVELEIVTESRNTNSSKELSGMVTPQMIESMFSSSKNSNFFDSTGGPQQPLKKLIPEQVVERLRSRAIALKAQQMKESSVVPPGGGNSASTETATNYVGAAQQAASSTSLLSTSEQPGVVHANSASAQLAAGGPGALHQNKGSRPLSRTSSRGRGIAPGTTRIASGLSQSMVFSGTSTSTSINRTNSAGKSAFGAQRSNSTANSRGRLQHQTGGFSRSSAGDYVVPANSFAASREREAAQSTISLLGGNASFKAGVRRSSSVNALSGRGVAAGPAQQQHVAVGASRPSTGHTVEEVRRRKGGAPYRVPSPGKGGPSNRNSNGARNGNINRMSSGPSQHHAYQPPTRVVSVNMPSVATTTGPPSNLRQVAGCTVTSSASCQPKIPAVAAEDAALGSSSNPNGSLVVVHPHKNNSSASAPSATTPGAPSTKRPSPLTSSKRASPLTSSKRPSPLQQQDSTRSHLLKLAHQRRQGSMTLSEIRQIKSRSKQGPTASEVRHQHAKERREAMEAAQEEVLRQKELRRENKEMLERSVFEQEPSFTFSRTETQSMSNLTGFDADQLQMNSSRVEVVPKKDFFPWTCKSQDGSAAVSPNE
ncbi:unnamed protein product [Amoebophrya sp. A120]|nr:unnamed protein product [Amoebophrya sp. A120]|eukprot:GSA120T00017083001.1